MHPLAKRLNLKTYLYRYRGIGVLQEFDKENHERVMKAIGTTGYKRLYQVSVEFHLIFAVYLSIALNSAFRS